MSLNQELIQKRCQEIADSLKSKKGGTRKMSFSQSHVVVF
jgi:hypothetical protein